MKIQAIVGLLGVRLRRSGLDSIFLGKSTRQTSRGNNCLVSALVLYRLSCIWGQVDQCSVMIGVCGVCTSRGIGQILPPILGISLQSCMKYAEGVSRAFLMVVLLVK
jgi:hypothetical protein